VKIEIQPVSRWAKQRCHEYGTTFTVLEDGMYRGNPAWLLESEDKSWQGWALKKFDAKLVREL
jgi:hypothetical protein